MSKSGGSEPRAAVGEGTAVLLCGGLGIVFRQDGDRWTDTILGHDPVIVRANSAPIQHGSEDPARVVSPVYQDLQLHRPQIGFSLCLLLTGLFFKHHFSAAVTLAADPRKPGRVLLDFDVADRCRSDIESLAATYLVGLDTGALAAADLERIAWRVASPTSGLLELVAIPPATLAMAEAGRQATRVRILAALQPGTFTHRLGYGWRWTSDDGLTL
jgi:hypothetical protein